MIAVFCWLKQGYFLKNWTRNIRSKTNIILVTIIFLAPLAAQGIKCFFVLNCDGTLHAGKQQMFALKPQIKLNSKIVCICAAKTTLSDVNIAIE
jgi:hypothetical protein